MNTSEFTTLINNPNAVGLRHGLALEKIISEFPYLQSARALYLKNLHNQDSFKYNGELKITAAYTTDRSVLFEFITSDNFQAIQKAFFDEKQARINEIKVNSTEIVKSSILEKQIESKLTTLEESIITSIEAAQPKQANIPENILTDSKKGTAPTDAEMAREKLEVGKPLDFSKEEKHSFQEWLQLSSFKPIDRQGISSAQINSAEKPKEAVAEKDLEKQKKIELIDKFIESNPKIPPIKNMVITQTQERNSQDNSYLMTETLAKVYLEQKKYQKAIQAYEILILKYPEKSHFFADRILDIKTLQQNNNN